MVSYLKITTSHFVLLPNDYWKRVMGTLSLVKKVDRDEIGT